LKLATVHKIRYKVSEDFIVTGNKKMIHLSKKTRQLPDRGITFPFMPANILPYLLGPNETLTWDLSMPATTAAYDYDNICDLHPGKSRSNNKPTYADSKVYYYGYRYYSPEMGGG
jgi:hypothetical protein